MCVCVCVCVNVYMYVCVRVCVWLRDARQIPRCTNIMYTVHLFNAISLSYMYPQLMIFTLPKHGSTGSETMSTVFKKGEISEDVSELTDPVALNMVIVREDVGIEQGGAVGSCVWCECVCMCVCVCAYVCVCVCAFIQE